MSHGLSAVIPVYNAATWLGPTVEHLSIALQEAGLSSNEAEIILVNDGSTDNSLQVARSLSSPYPIVIRRPAEQWPVHGAQGWLAGKWQREHLLH